MTVAAYRRVEMGDRRKGNFAPHALMDLWNGECKFAVEYPSAHAIPPSVANDVLEWHSPAEKVKVRMYHKEFQGIEDGAFEYEIVLEDPPASPQIVLNVETEGLDFFYQGPLPQEDIDAGHIRPDNVIGSYAVYHKTCGVVHSAENAEKYRCGKAFHIYRPELIDAGGNRVWADLSVDYIAGTLTITMDSAWLASAQYPVTVDPTFGYTTAGASSGYLGDQLWASGYGSPATDGTTASMSVYCSSDTASIDVKVGLYSDSSGPASKVGTERETTDIGVFSAQWKAFTMNAIAITGGTNYWPTGHNLNVGFFYVYYDTPGGTNRYWDTETYGSAWPSTFTKNSNSSSKYSMYITYGLDYTYTGAVLGPWFLVSGRAIEKLVSGAVAGTGWFLSSRAIERVATGGFAAVDTWASSKSGEKVLTGAVSAVLTWASPKIIDISLTGTLSSVQSWLASRMIEKYLDGSVTAVDTWTASITGVKVDQEYFRYFKDDGNEASATALEALNTNRTGAANEVVRLRFLVYVTGVAGDRQYQLEWRREGTSDWRKVIQ